MMQRNLPERVATFERRASGELRVGAAEADITPGTEQWLAGFSLARSATGTHSPLRARAIVFEVGALRIAVVGVDNLGLQRQDVDWIKSGIAGIPNGCVLLCSSHTHAAPDLVGLWGWYLLSSGRDRAYLAQVRAGIVEAVAGAVARLRPARLVRGAARAPREGWMRNTNRAGVFDPRLTVLQAYDRDDGAPLAALLHVPCHPEVLRRDNTLVSADFVGDLCDRWRDAGLGQAVFVNGALGAMVTPRPRGVEAVARFGGELFDAMRRSLESARPVEVRDAEIRRRDVFLPMQSLMLSLARALVLIPRDLYAGHLRSTVGYLRIGELEACALPGETEPGFAARVYSGANRADMLLLGLVDDEVGYLMSERDARDPEFGYERGMSPGPESGERVLEALIGR